MNANNIVVPRWQQGRCLAFRQSTWEWHVQVRNEATSEQEDDLEHTGEAYFSHSQRQPAHLNGAGVQARGISRACAFFFWKKCCARCNNSGSHEYMLNWSSVDNSIAQIGQRSKGKQHQSKKPAPTTKHQQTKTDQSMKGETGETCLRSHYLVHSSKPRLSQPLQQLVECHTSINSIPCGPQLPGRA